MPKMIDSALLKENLAAKAREKGGYEDARFTMKDVEDLIDEQPRADVEKVTRCKECMEYLITTGRCRRWGIHVRDDNNFCLYGMHLEGYMKGKV